MVSALSFDGVGMVYPDSTKAVRDLSFGVSPGELVALVGPSGCGKSTVLRIASGLLRSTAGSVSRSPGEMGFVFQDPTLLPWRTVMRNVELLGELRRLPVGERARRAREAIDLVGLGGFEDHHPRELSGGMRMRVSLARALTMEPQLFLFDEPFGPLDEITRERLQDEVLRLFERVGFSALFVTHSIAEAVYLASRVLVMSARPGTLVCEVDVPFPYPRAPELRFDAQLASVSGRVFDALRGSDA